MDLNRKYFGMTVQQIGILAALAVVLLIIVFCGGLYVLKSDGLAPSASPMPLATSTITPISASTPTLTPTITPTPMPYDSLIPSGWNQYKNDLVEIWLPNNFKLADKKTKNITAGFAIPALLITEIPSKSIAYPMQASVSYDLITGDSLDDFLNNKFPTLPYQARVADRRTVFVNTVGARRIVIEMRVNDLDYDDLVYVFRDGSTVWYVEYVAEITRFFDNLPVFEQSIQTFRIAR